VATTAYQIVDEIMNRFEAISAQLVVADLRIPVLYGQYIENAGLQVQAVGV
jgi:hypothetical protein